MPYNRERANKYAAEYRLAHKEELKEKAKQYYNKNKLARSAYSMKYREKHREKLKKYAQQYRMTYPKDCWKQMIYRCYNPSNKSYCTYGARGIKVCSEWLEYSNFEKWAIHNGWNCALTIDRINNDGDYCPENCRFITRSQNIAQRNKVWNNKIEQKRDSHGRFSKKDSR